MLKCFRAHSFKLELLAAGSTGGVATTLAYYCLEHGLADKFLVARPFTSFLASGLQALKESCGSIYEEFEYVKPDVAGHVGQIGKPCDMDPRFSPRISVFCSRILKRKGPRLQKKEYTAWSRPKRYIVGLRLQPHKCRVCKDHVGLKADIAVGDSQRHQPKINHVIVRTDLGLKIWQGAIDAHMIHAEPIRLDLIKHRQPYLFGGGPIKWLWEKTKKQR